MGAQWLCLHIVALLLGKVQSEFVDKHLVVIFFLSGYITTALLLFLLILFLGRLLGLRTKST
jgi:predicted membrane protein